MKQTLLAPEALKPLEQPDQFLPKELAKLAFETRGPRHDNPALVWADSGKCEIKFNVMDARNVSETFNLKQYRMWPNYAEALFDRKYMSEMINSPDHLIFLTGLIHCQRLIYSYLCFHFGCEYSQEGREQFKIWPVKLNLSLSEMIVANTDVTQKLLVTDLRNLGGGKHMISTKSKFNDALEWSGSCLIYDVRGEGQ